MGHRTRHTRARATTRRATTRRAGMKRKHLESLLSHVDGFAEPKQDLEQYPTNPELCAGVMHCANRFGDVRDKCVVDLGVGCGMLSIASVLCDAGSVIGVDVDDDALDAARDNAEAFEPALEIDLVRCDVIESLAKGRGRWAGKLRADTVFMNPPFGTRRRGADAAFIRAAFRIATGAVYSLHKSSTRAHIEKFAVNTLKARKAEVLAQLRYDLPATYAHHRQKSVEIAVDLWRFEPPEDGADGLPDSDDDSDDDGGSDDGNDGGSSGIARDFSRKANVSGRGSGRSGGRGRGRGRGRANRRSS